MGNNAYNYDQFREEIGAWVITSLGILGFVFMTNRQRYFKHHAFWNVALLTLPIVTVPAIRCGRCLPDRRGVAWWGAWRLDRRPQACCWLYVASGCCWQSAWLLLHSRRSPACSGLSPHPSLCPSCFCLLPAHLPFLPAGQTAPSSTLAQCSGW